MASAGTLVPGGAPFRLGYLGSPEAAARITAAVRATAGDIVVELTEASIASPFATLRRGAVDALVTRFHIVEPDLVTGPVLFMEERVLAVGAGHPLAERNTVDTEDIADHEVFERPDMFPADVYDQLVPPHSATGRPIRRTQRAATLGEMFALIASGVAVHPTISSMRADDAGGIVRYLPIRDLPPSPVTLTWRGADNRPRLRAFVTAVARAFAADRSGDAVVAQP